MNINRRKFFRIITAGAAAATIPKFLQPEKIQGKLATYQEPGDALDTKALKELGLWDIREERDYTAYEIEKHEIIPDRAVEGDYVEIPIYAINDNNIDWSLELNDKIKTHIMKTRLGDALEGTPWYES